MTQKYMTYLKVLKSGEEVIGDIYDTDIYEWVMAPFKPLLVELAPPPECNPKDIKITLDEHQFPEFVVFELDIIDEKLCPRRVVAETSPVRPSFVSSFVCFFDDFLDDLETWAAFYDPAGIVRSFQDPEDALFKPPSKVLIDHCETECFFKPCNSGVQTKRELETYKMIHATGLDSRLNLCHLYGIVMDEYDFILRIDAAVSGLHDAGIIWGNVKAENVSIDQDSNAWVTDFGGGYTKGWVDKEVAETMEGDRMGMAKLREFVFPAASKAEL
ncbi:hypothetical protein DER46DRAFT_621008 [Fusarium sp. MPI-SDFR-AT-0072]|nr:hypothetical protein DER46DRAFT_621008 [Fusarium sp. MPI-SDFR-AT-0072]